MVNTIDKIMAKIFVPVGVAAILSGAGILIQKDSNKIIGFGGIAAGLHTMMYEYQAKKRIEEESKSKYEDKKNEE